MLLRGSVVVVHEGYAKHPKIATMAILKNAHRHGKSQGPKVTFGGAEQRLEGNKQPA